VYDGSNAWNREFYYSYATVKRNANNRSNGFSVRCVRESKGTNAKEPDFFSKKRVTGFNKGWNCYKTLY
jgi:hypothetical protein